MKEEPLVLAHEVNGVVVDKPEKDLSKKDKENMQRRLKVKNIITTTLGLNEFLRVSHNEIAKEMWDILQITHEGTTEVNRKRLSTSTHEYELFRMKLEENINQMKTCFSHILSHMRTLGKTFSNEELVIKILICLNHSWQPKFLVICESKDIMTMDTHAFFDKLQEHEIEFKRLDVDEEEEKKNKSITLKAKQSNSDDDMALIVKSFKRFMKKEKEQAE